MSARVLARVEAPRSYWVVDGLETEMPKGMPSDSIWSVAAGPCTEKVVVYKTDGVVITYYRQDVEVEPK